jgi:hypothetical protein
MERFCVSRPTLREAIRVLEMELLLRMRRGGTLVTAPDPRGRRAPSACSCSSASKPAGYSRGPHNDRALGRPPDRRIQKTPARSSGHCISAMRRPEPACETPPSSRTIPDCSTRAWSREHGIRH